MPKTPLEYPLNTAYIRAAKIGPTRKLDRIHSIVVHRLASGNAESACKYITSLSDGRVVSWHFTVSESGQVFQHAPLDRTTWHCQYPEGTNSTSVGIEIYGPMGSKVSKEAHKTVFELCQWLRLKLPAVVQIASHKFMDSLGPRKTKTDPGPEFDHTILSSIGLALRF